MPSTLASCELRLLHEKNVETAVVTAIDLCPVCNAQLVSFLVSQRATSPMLFLSFLLVLARQGGANTTAEQGEALSVLGS